MPIIMYLRNVLFGVGGTPKGLHLDAYYYVLNIPQYDLIAYLFQAGVSAFIVRLKHKKEIPLCGQLAVSLNIAWLLTGPGP